MKGWGLKSFWDRIDRWVPRDLSPTGEDGRFRARLLVASSLLASLSGVVCFVLFHAIGAGTQAWYCLAGGASVLVAIPILQLTRRLDWAGHALLFVAIAAIELTPTPAPDHPRIGIALCGIGFAAAHLLGPRAGLAWTAVAVALASWNAIAIQDPRFLPPAWNTPVVAAFLGAGAAMIEASRRRALDQASREQRRLRVLGDAAFHWILEAQDEILTYVSPSVAGALGRTPEALVGLPMLDFVHPEETVPLRQVLRDEAPDGFRVEHRALHADGSWLWCESYAIPHPEPESAHHWIIACRNIERERSERDRTQRAETLEGIGVLAAGVAHDFNNVLTAIAGHAQMLPQDEDRDEILKATDRASHLTQQLLAFGREQPVESTTFDVRDVFRDLHRMIGSFTREEVELEVDSGHEPCWVHGHRRSLEQVLLNLVYNARDAIARRGSITLRAGVEPCRTRVRIEVRDDGQGMPETIRRRAFDPFFTTKDVGRGNGLGLASAHGLVRQLGGEIELRSEPGEGTTAIVQLPCAAAPVAKQHEAVARALPSTGTGRVLIAEDDDTIRALIARALRGAGYGVVTARDGLEALARLEAHDERIDLLITDVVMPQLRGSEVAQRVREIRPVLPILFISGYDNDELGGWKDRADGIAFLAKPFSIAALLDKTARLFASAATPPTRAPSRRAQPGRLPPARSQRPTTSSASRGL
ncbi:MAG: ATP-binding protein [Myxococcota bacterium]